MRVALYARVSTLPQEVRPDTSPVLQSAGSPAAKAGRGLAKLGGDEDYPVTMLGGSLILTWDDPVDGLDDTGIYGWSSLGATANEVRLVLRDRSVTPTSVNELRVRRKNGMALGIAVELMGTQELQFATDTVGKNLTVQSASSGGDLHTYIRHSRFVMEHPEHEKRVTRITFSNVAPVTPLPGSCMKPSPTSTTVVCTIDTNHNIRSRIVVRVCQGATCPNPP